ncbi:acyltransferase family protein [Pseudobutyrivibrio sp. 49]|uniref:acyltransferase family protein n=1 Tax=Pseudobutyrivibrio sp. 49 TaxID=1855344 RepID=UPI000B7E429D|nr:acyltransferase [Pseudobutyrivibrio sp. 49]
MNNVPSLSTGYKSFFEGKINFFNGKFYFGLVVELFFILSGYFMYDYIKKIEEGYPFPKFYVKRLVRFFPLLFISAACYEVILNWFEQVFLYKWSDISISLWGLIITSLGIQAGWSLDNPVINNPTWYISVLMLCYVIFYFLIYIAKRLNLKVEYLFIVMIFIGMGIRDFGLNLPFLNASSCRGYYAFFFGVLFAEFLRKHKITKKETLICGLVPIILTLLIVYTECLMVKGIDYVMTFVYYPALIIFCKYGIGNILNHPFIGLMGKISFDVFIWHHPVNMFMIIAIYRFNIPCNIYRFRTMLIYALICWVVGTISYICIDKPIAGLIKRKFKYIS